MRSCSALIHRDATSATRLPPITSSPGPTFRGSASRDTSVDGSGRMPRTGVEDPGVAASGAVTPCACDGAGEGLPPPPSAPGATIIFRSRSAQRLASPLPRSASPAALRAHPGEEVRQLHPRVVPRDDQPHLRQRHPGPAGGPSIHAMRSGVSRFCRSCTSRTGRRPGPLQYAAVATIAGSSGLRTGMRTAGPSNSPAR
ncbi:hypothetical protein STENM223S_04926 [Streptomyces tendae]